MLGYGRFRQDLGVWLLIVVFVTASTVKAVPTPGMDDETRNTKPHDSAAPPSKQHVDTTKAGTDSTKDYWERTFREIKDLQILFPETSPLLTQWKLFLDDGGGAATTNGTTATQTTAVTEQQLPLSLDQTMQKPRFDGFRSWDRLLQEWAEDVADYFERNAAESGSYPMSTFGRPSDGVLEEEEQETIPPAEPSSEEDSEQVQTTSSVVEALRRTVLSPPPVTLVTKSSTEQPFVPRLVQQGEAILPHTDISDKSKSIWIVTTASLPWMTGTGVNPLLRAAYMTKGRKQAGGKVTLMLPWLENRADQEKVYGKDKVFGMAYDQEEYVRSWLRDTAGMKEASEELNLAWYPARLEPAENSIYSMGDITALIPAAEVDICILEEPEHLNWYRAPGENWTTKFKHVVGIIHTNYFVYATEQPAAFVRAPAMRLLCSWMCRAHCHRVIKLSGTLQSFAPEKELVENVHGVRGTFLDIGEQVRQILTSRKVKEHPVFAPDADPSVYFIGKMLWSKGLGSLMELLKYAEESADLKLQMDMYGGGPDKDAAEAKSRKLDIDLTFHGPVDHAKLALSHKVFVNPSTSEVLCTTTAEALAMGKFVVLPSHPSNDFFAQFPNCLTYTNKEEFVGNLYYALTHSPAPLTKEYAYALSWSAATERLEAAGSISVEEAERMAEVMESKELGIEIDLPPLIDDDERRRKIASTFRLSRARYRQFRSRLSEEIKQSKVLPKELQRRLTMELDKRLELDIDTVLASPKLRIQLSPAELDKRLLAFYNDVIRGPSGDALRVIGGGANVGMQNLYMKTQARKQRQRERLARTFDPAFDPVFNLPSFMEDGDETDETNRTPTEWVTLALQRNLPLKNSNFIPKASSAKVLKDDKTTKMTMRTTPLSVTKLPTRKWISGPLI
ncbi:digalactosyldiacylglycerol synthase [Fragilaria crotonensis]|nr:digalactosyldiacylglycerol synthase [Fragilaria crotonensis]